MATVSGKDLGEALCKAVGIDPEGVGKVSILLNDDAKIVVEKVIDVEDAGALIAAIRAIKRDAVK